MSSQGKKIGPFDRLLLDETISLSESLAVRKYESMSVKDRASVSSRRPELSSQFERLDCYIETHGDVEIDTCRKAIAMLVSELGFSNVRDPRHLMRTSTYRVVTKRIRHDDPDPDADGESDEDPAV